MEPTRLATLPEVEAAIWQGLKRACADPKHAWRTPVLATVDAQGLPDARTVVLRECDAVTRSLVIFTDARSAKVAQLEAQANAVLVIWAYRPGAWQLRINARFAVQTAGPAVASRWARVKESPAERDYLSPVAPGSVAGGVDPKTTSQPDQTSQAHFAVLTAQVNSIDWLELHREGHRRARFDASGATWLVP
jgi:pyridoxamine 5'-phosphate oxidase